MLALTWCLGLADGSRSDLMSQGSVHNASRDKKRWSEYGSILLVSMTRNVFVDVCVLAWGYMEGSAILNTTSCSN